MMIIKSSSIHLKHLLTLICGFSQKVCSQTILRGVTPRPATHVRPKCVNEPTSSEVYESIILMIHRASGDSKMTRTRGMEIHCRNCDKEIYYYVPYVCRICQQEDLVLGFCSDRCLSSYLADDDRIASC